MAASLLPNLSPKNYSSMDLEDSSTHAIIYSKDMSKQWNGPSGNKAEPICDVSKLDEKNESSVRDIKSNEQK